MAKHRLDLEGMDLLRINNSIRINCNVYRFRSALKEQPWKGIRNALREGNSCPHQNMLLDTYKGSEDCLFLNVYTKHLPNKDR